MQSLLDSDHLWLQGLQTWIIDVREYATKDINAVMEQPDKDFTPLKGVRTGIQTLFETTHTFAY